MIGKSVEVVAHGDEVKVIFRFKSGEDLGQKYRDMTWVEAIRYGDIDPVKMMAGFFSKAWGEGDSDANCQRVG